MRLKAGPRRRIELRQLGAGWRLALIDVAMLGVCVATTTDDVNPVSESFSGTQSSMLLAASVVPILFVSGSYGKRRRRRFGSELRTVVTSVAVAGALTVMLHAILVGRLLVDASHVMLATVVASLLLAGRVVVQSQPFGHEFTRPTLVVGAGVIGRQVARRLLDGRGPALPIGFLDDDPRAESDEPLPVPVLGGIEDFERIVAEHDVQEVVIAFSRYQSTAVNQLIRSGQTLGLRVSIVPRQFEAFPYGSVYCSFLGSVPVVSARSTGLTTRRQRLKAAIERPAALLLLLLFSPLMLPVAGLILITDGRPLFFKQVRLGPNGQTFAILKFRTMRVAPETSSPFAMEADVELWDASEQGSRTSRVGALLRAASIDELPQLFNVVRGQMSFVGPRPERPELVEAFSLTIPRYEERHRVRGGITGWSQVHGIGRGNDRFSDDALARRAEWDNYYIDHWSPGLDLRILLMTFRALWLFHQPKRTASPASLLTCHVRAGEPRREVPREPLSTPPKSP